AGRRVVHDRDSTGDGFREDALALQKRGDRRRHRAADRLPLTLVVDEEERRVPGDRTAEGAAELTAIVVGRGRERRLEEVACVQCLIAKELEPVAGMSRVSAVAFRSESSDHDASPSSMMSSTIAAGRTRAIASRASSIVRAGMIWNPEFRRYRS